LNPVIPGLEFGTGIEIPTCSTAARLFTMKKKKTYCRTKYLCFHNKKKYEDFTEAALNIKFRGTTLERVENCRILGLIVDESLNFVKHIEEIQKKIIPFAYAVKRIRSYLNLNTAIMLYYAFIQSRLMYMNVIWSAALAYAMNMIEIAQRKSLRILLNKEWFCSKKELYSIKILPVSTLSNVSLCMHVFKVSSNMIKNNVEIRQINEMHRYPTRTRENFVVPIYQTQLAKQDFYVRAFKEILVKNNISEISGGMLLCCNGTIAVKRIDTGKVTIEGCLSEEYFKVRELLYEQYAIV